MIVMARITHQTKCALLEIKLYNIYNKHCLFVHALQSHLKAISKL